MYGSEEARALLILSRLFNHLNAKRLRTALDNEFQRLHESGFLQVSSECYQKLKRVSPTTIDRLLAGRHSRSGERRGSAKPGTFLKHQIPVRTWADWMEDRPGFCVMDLVDHSSGRIVRGADHAWTLCFTGVSTAWTECAAVRSKAQVHVFAAIKRARLPLPFPLLGIDSDNGLAAHASRIHRRSTASLLVAWQGGAGVMGSLEERSRTKSAGTVKMAAER